MQDQAIQAFGWQTGFIITILIVAIVALWLLLFKRMEKKDEVMLSKIEKLFSELRESKNTDKVELTNLINNYRQDLKDTVASITTSTQIIEERIPKKT
jgi:sugar phosphate permease